MGFHKAEKHQLKLRMAIYGHSGSGKTYTGIGIGTTLGRRVGVIDTERGSASKYADTFDFEVLELGMDPTDPTPFHPERYIAAIDDAVKGGFDVLVIDSLSHAWAGKGGVLEHVDNVAAKKRGAGEANKFQAWADGTKVQNSLVDAILTAPMHVIVTMRAKQETVTDKDERGKTVIRKLGLTPVQRDNLEYEFDVVGEMDEENTLVIRKSRCSRLAGQSIPRPGPKVAEVLLEWLNGGKPAPPPQPRPVQQGPAQGPPQTSTPVEPPAPTVSPAQTQTVTAPPQPAVVAPPASAPATTSAAAPAPGPATTTRPVNELPGLRAARLYQTWERELPEQKPDMDSFLAGRGVKIGGSVDAKTLDMWESELETRLAKKCATAAASQPAQAPPPDQPHPQAAAAQQVNMAALGQALNGASADAGAAQQTEEEVIF